MLDQTSLQSPCWHLHERQGEAAVDVHDAWTAWQQEIQPDHEALKPYQDLPTDVQAEDRPFLLAIHAAAAEQPH